MTGTDRHEHGPAPGADPRWLSGALALILAFMAGEVVAGLVAHSLALISDAAHMLTDAASIALVLVTARLAARPPGAGPVPALRRGLAEAAEPWAAVLAADLPFLGEAHLGMLLRAAAGHHGAVLVDDAGRPQWLAGCWRTEALRRRAAAYDGSSLRGLLGPLAPVLVAVTPGTGEPPPWLDCDTPEDLRRARAWIPGSRQHGNDPGI